MNKNKAFDAKFLAQTLLHECFHYTVREGIEYHETLSGDQEHLALAMLGDLGEIDSVERYWKSIAEMKKQKRE